MNCTNTHIGCSVYVTVTARAAQPKSGFYGFTLHT